MAVNAKHRILIVEDDAVIRSRLIDTISTHPDFIVCDAVGTIKQAREALQSKPDIVLVDLGLPDGDGVDLIRQVFLAKGSVECLVITVFGDDGHIISALEAGASGYILKDDSQVNIIDCLLNLLQGGSPISPMIARKILHRFRDPATSTVEKENPLTKREQDVLKMMARGYSHAEAAKIFDISYHTIIFHVKNIYKKLAVNSRSEAIYEAEHMGLFKLTEKP